MQSVWLPSRRQKSAARTIWMASCGSEPPQGPLPPVAGACGRPSSIQRLHDLTVAPPSPSSDTSAFKSIRAFIKRCAELFPFRINAWSCSHSSALSRTTYFLYQHFSCRHDSAPVPTVATRANQKILSNSLTRATRTRRQTAQGGLRGRTAGLGQAGPGTCSAPMVVWPRGRRRIERPAA
jgi:hypothetical protein